MVAENHYDDDALVDLLRNQMGWREDTALAHVESCSACQERLETISQAGITWDEVSDLLRPSPDPGDPTPNPSPTFLEPSDHPESLGRFARYEVMELLGRGGMGIVMRGFDTSLNRHSAIKVLAPELASSAAARKRFSREAKSAAAVVHPHVVPIQTVDEFNGLPYLVMPVVEGQSLQQRIDQDGPLSVIEAVRIASQVAEGLAAAHDQGLVHRDIKPANVLLENGVERVQLTDFGLARAVDDASMTRSGVIAGTPQYMSPEQAHGDTIDHRSDLFSLGSLIYFMLTGRSPFRAETTMGVLNRIGNDAPRSIRSINADVPQWLEQTVMKLLSKSPDDRFQTAAEVAKSLHDWHAHLQQPDIVKPPQNAIVPLVRRSGVVAAGKGSRGSFKWLTATAAFAFFAILATVIILETNKGTIRIESNSQADVSIRIVRSEKVVDELSVSQSGAKTRLRAGQYSIEVDGDATDIEISGDCVSIRRGNTWLVKVSANAGSIFGVKIPPKISPFTRMMFKGDKVHVDVSSQTYELLGIDEFSVDQLKKQARKHFGSYWQKRFSEDLVSLLWKMEHKPGDRVDLHLRSIESGEEIHLEEVKMTNALRMRLYRDNEHNQPEVMRKLRGVGSNDAVDGHSQTQAFGTWPILTYTLAGKVHEFNQRMVTSDGDDPQPPLTVDELLAFSQWQLQTDGELTAEVKDLLTNLGVGRYLPEQWAITGGESKVVTNDGEIDVYKIELVNRYTDSKVLVRRRYNAPPVNFQQPRRTAPIDSATPLAAGIAEFNAMHNTIAGKRQPPLTVNEVLAAIVDWNSRRNEAAVDNKTFANFQEIGETHQLPADCKLEVIPTFGSREGDTFKIWSVRVVMPQVAKPSHTYAFEIRQQCVSVDSVTDGVIHWGKPNDKGLQAGVRLIPGQRAYQVGQPIATEFHYRSISGKPIENVTIPNIFYHKKLIARDSNGNELDVVEVIEMTIGGAVETEVGEKPTIKRGKPLSLGYITPVWGFDIGEGYPAETHLTVTDGMKCFLTYVVSDLDGGELKTGEVVFGLAGHKTATRPTAKDANLARETTLGEAVKLFNAQSAGDRKSLFDPPIPDMTVEQLRKAFQDTAALYQQSGDQIVANALNQIAKLGKLPFGLPSILHSSGLVTTDKSGALLTKQIAPVLIIMDGPDSGRYVPLQPVELIYNRFGKSSKAYGDLFDSKQWSATSAQRFDTSALQPKMPQQPGPYAQPAAYQQPNPHRPDAMDDGNSSRVRGGYADSSDQRGKIATETVRKANVAQ